MKISLNLVKKFIDLPSDLTPKQIAYDLTMRTVEVEDVEDTSLKFHDIVVGEVKEVKAHPNADALRICMVDCGEDEIKQIVCGGSNLYAGEKVVVSKPGAEVYWHGESELVKIKESKLRGEPSFGMICGASEVYLDGFFSTEDEHLIVDISDYDCYPGQNIAELIGMKDFVFEVDNKSLTNRPDLWGHYGIARELSAIYDLELKPLDKFVAPELPLYPIEIEDTEKCPRYTGLKIDNISIKESPIWMKADIINAGMRPINAIVDITNYVLLAIGQPEHAFDSSHVEGGKIVVRNAKEGEKLLLLNNANLDLTTDDLVICDTVEPMGLAGIRGGIKDSILPTTTSVLLEVANFTASTIRKTEKRFNEKTDAGIRYEKGLDTQRVADGLALSMKLFKELFPECEFTAFADVYPAATERAEIDLEREFLDTRLGKVIDDDTMDRILTKLGYEYSYDGKVYHCFAPTWRSTGDVSIKDDIMGDIARILCYESFEARPLPVNFESAVRQPDFLLERRLKEYLAFRCGFNEIFTYPWVDEKYLNAAKVDFDKCVRLATPPSPETAHLRPSLVPGCLEAIEKNLRYFDEFKIFEAAQCFEKGEYHQSCEEEVLPVHKNLVGGAIVGKDPIKIFFQMKGVIEGISSYCHCDALSFKEGVIKPTWADSKVYLNIMNGKEVVGAIGLASVQALSDAGIKRTNAAVFQLNLDKIHALASRDNSFEHLPVYPLVEQDLSLLVDETITFAQVKESVKYMVKSLRFVEEYRGKQIPEGKKSLMIKIKIGNDDSTMSAKQIEKKMKGIINQLKNKCGAELRD